MTQPTCPVRSLSTLADRRNSNASVEVLNSVPGRDLHRFFWLEDDEIGALPPTYNWLEGTSDPSIDPKVIHYTRGGPWFEDWQNVAYAQEWLDERDAYRATL